MLFSKYSGRTPAARVSGSLCTSDCSQFWIQMISQWTKFDSTDRVIDIKTCNFTCSITDSTRSGIDMFYFTKHVDVASKSPSFIPSISSDEVLPSKCVTELNGTNTLSLEAAHLQASAAVAVVVLVQSLQALADLVAVPDHVLTRPRHQHGARLGVPSTPALPEGANQVLRYIPGLALHHVPMRRGQRQKLVHAHVQLRTGTRQRTVRVVPAPKHLYARAHGGVVLQHVEDVAVLQCLLHGV